MEAYTGFALVYDRFMDNVPYEDWSGQIKKILKDYGITEGILLDLCCGTGKLTRLLAAAGFDMIGVDNSYEMLEIAREAEGEGSAEENSDEAGGILYLNQDACEFELYGTVQAVISACDSLNYITAPEDLLEVFKLVNNYLESRGLFIFDLNTPYKYRELLAQETFAENREDCAFIWDNYYDEEEKINEYDLTLFVKNEDDSFERFEETHYERCYTLDEIKDLLEQAGMEFVGAYDGYTDRPLAENSDRMVIVAREKRTEGKHYE